MRLAAGRLLVAMNQQNLLLPEPIADDVPPAGVQSPEDMLESLRHAVEAQEVIANTPVTVVRDAS